MAFLLDLCLLHLRFNVLDNEVELTKTKAFLIFSVATNTLVVLAQQQSLLRIILTLIETVIYTQQKCIFGKNCLFTLVKTQLSS